MLGQASQDVPSTGGSRKPFPPQTTTLPFMLGWNLDAAVKYAYAGGRGMFSPSPPQGNGTFFTFANTFKGFCSLLSSLHLGNLVAP